MLISENSTPFEKSIAKRIAKAAEIRSIAANKTGYTSQTDLESVQMLTLDLSRLAGLNADFFTTINSYYQTSMKRKELFQGKENSIKQTALLIKNTVFEDAAYCPNKRKQIKQIYEAIKGQNPISPPIDLAVKSSDKNVAAFLSSYQILISSFKAMKAALEKFDYQPKSEDCSLANCQVLLQSAEHLSNHIEALLQKLFAANETRTECYLMIRRRCLAIQNRFRFLYGSGDADYRKICKHKL
ncbi:hypothetical protein ACFP1I_08735 [Dyadobacter subterraneus]|uniref:Uncharacterized protein n=1 Tax=Dyadobacter subterraneus TaxID=2773304 RepID=A0ABR9WE56_9BACT|nr:hypothetical protein [Dyadobacter subterraneus]MBE9463775.1 hypothetical protein [Dyadobacter subterraneus]